MKEIIFNAISNIYFWSSLSGFTGTVLIFFFGIESHINEKGEQSMLLEQVDKSMAKKARIYKFLSHLGIALLGFSFLLEVITILSF